MALGATIYHLRITLSDVDRGVYESLDLRPAQHPSESLRHLVTRTLAYALSYEEGVAFSKGGVSTGDEPAVVVRDRTGAWVAWIEVGSPSADRLHKATKAAPRVAIFTESDLALLRREAAARKIHRVEHIEVWRIEPALVDAVIANLTRSTAFELARTDGRLYVTLAAHLIESPVVRSSLV